VPWRMNVHDNYNNVPCMLLSKLGPRGYKLGGFSRKEGKHTWFGSTLSLVIFCCIPHPTLCNSKISK